MIFFLTTIIPSSNVDVMIDQYKRKLFRENTIVPFPWPLIPVTLKKYPPVLLSRQSIAEKYPAILTPKNIEVSKGDLLLNFHEAIPFDSDFTDSFNSEFHKNSLLFGEIIYNRKLDPIKEISFPPFRNYSIAAYKIQLECETGWWKQISWTKLWQVKKSKKQ